LTEGLILVNLVTKLLCALKKSNRSFTSLPASSFPMRPLEFRTPCLDSDCLLKGQQLAVDPQLENLAGSFGLEDITIHPGPSIQGARALLALFDVLQCMQHKKGF